MMDKIGERQMVVFIVRSKDIRNLSVLNFEKVQIQRGQLIIEKKGINRKAAVLHVGQEVRAVLLKDPDKINERKKDHFHLNQKAQHCRKAINDIQDLIRARTPGHLNHLSKEVKNIRKIKR